MSHDFKDILYTVAGGIATLTINRPEKMNSVTAETLRELEVAFDAAGNDPEVGVVVFTGAGEKSFCAGADVSWQKAGKMGHGGPAAFTPPYLMISRCPKPVIARVNGYAIGGGNVLVTICDLAIASETAIFGQVGPKVGSVDPGFGTAYLARIIGEKRAREIWYLCRKYSAKEALEWGLINAVVPPGQLDAETKKWCNEILQMSPTAIALAKRSFNVDSESIRGIGAFAMQALALYYETDESKEGGNAFREKRKPEFRKYVK